MHVRAAGGEVQEPPTIQSGSLSFHSSPLSFHSSPLSFHSSPLSFHSSPPSFHSSPLSFHSNPLSIQSMPSVWERIQKLKHSGSPYEIPCEWLQMQHLRQGFQAQAQPPQAPSGTWAP